MTQYKELLSISQKKIIVFFLEFLKPFKIIMASTVVLQKKYWEKKTYFSKHNLLRVKPQFSVEKKLVFLFIILNFWKFCAKLSKKKMKTGNELWVLFITMRLSFFCPFQKQDFKNYERKKAHHLNNNIPNHLYFSVCDIIKTKFLCWKKKFFKNKINTRLQL